MRVFAGMLVEIMIEKYVSSSENTCGIDRSELRGRADCEATVDWEKVRILRKGGLWVSQIVSKPDCEKWRIVRKGGLWGRADCQVMAADCEEGRIVRLWQIVRMGGLWGRADCEERRGNNVDLYKCMGYNYINYYIQMQECTFLWNSCQRVWEIENVVLPVPQQIVTLRCRRSENDTSIHDILILFQSAINRACNNI